MIFNPQKLLKLRLFNSRKKRIVWALVLIVLVVVVLFVLWLTADNEGKISDPSGSARSNVPSYKDFDGKFITFRYSGMYGVRALPTANQDLELYNFSASTMYQKNIAVSVSELTAGSLNNNSAYNLRRSQPDKYAQRDIQVAGMPATLWVKHDGKEETAIIPKGDRVAVLSFTTAGPTGQLGSEVTALLQTFTWK